MFTVLVVEDNPVTAELLEMVLIRIPGLLVETVRSAGEAREALASSRHFSAIITDVHLPGEDGISLAGSVRTMAGRTNVPVIVMTSSRESGLRERAEAAGAYAFIEKPWSAVQLRDTVNSLLNGT